jgi:predicted transcriptional regulator of viral defense system
MPDSRRNPALIEQVSARLARTAALAGRPGVLLTDSDLPELDPLVGSRARAYRIIDHLEAEGRLRKIRRGAYALVSPTGNVTVDLLDLVDALTPRPYLVTAGRALQFHGLTDQHFRRVVVLIHSQLRRWKWRGDEVRYARTARRRLKGAATRTRRTNARVASAEGALVDSLGHSGWGVTLSQSVEALDAALRSNRTFPDLLAIETAEHGTHALARRAGFLISRLAGEEAARPFIALRGDSKAITPLAPGGAHVGPIDSTWRVRENVAFERLAAHRREG